MAALLSHQPIPRGARVAILTNAGGPGILAADACEANGLELPSLSDATRAELRAFLPAAASVGNPVDMLASAPADHYRRALAAILRDESVDSVVAIFIPPLVTEPDAVAAAIVEGARGEHGKPVLGVFMRAEGAPAALRPVPCYSFPESAALALARVTTYGRWRARPAVPPPSLDRFTRGSIRAIVEQVLGRGGGWTTAEEAASLLAAAGIPCAPARVAGTADSAVLAAAALGYPVALKALGPTLLHKTERRAVSLNLSDDAALRAAFDDFSNRFAGEMTSVLVQRMVPAGVEMIVGALHDPLFGPLIACGTGGVLVDLLADSAFRLHPLTEPDAVEMIDQLKGARLLRGYRGAAPADETALRDVLLRVSELVTAAPEIQELDLNPVMVMASGASRRGRTGPDRAPAAAGQLPTCRLLIPELAGCPRPLRQRQLHARERTRWRRRSRASTRSAMRSIRRRSSPRPITAASSPTSTTSSAISRSTHGRNCSGRITGSSIPATIRRSSCAGCGGRSPAARCGAARSATGRRTARSTGSTPPSCRSSTAPANPASISPFAATSPHGNRPRPSFANRPPSPTWASSPRSWRTKCATRWPVCAPHCRSWSSAVPTGATARSSRRWCSASTISMPRSRICCFTPVRNVRGCKRSTSGR